MVLFLPPGIFENLYIVQCIHLISIGRERDFSSRFLKMDLTCVILVNLGGNNPEKYFKHVHNFKYVHVTFTSVILLVCLKLHTQLRACWIKALHICLFKQPIRFSSIQPYCLLLVFPTPSLLLCPSIIPPF